MVEISKDEAGPVLDMKEDEVKEIFGSVQLKIDDEVKEKLRKNKVTSAVKEKSSEYNDDDAVQLYKEFSSFLETSADIIPDTGIKDTISTGIDLLDAILGGGFVIGALNMIIGPAGCGKTMLSIQTLAQAQKQFKGNMIGGFLDSEEAVTTTRLQNLGVKYPKLKPYNDVTIEKVFKFLEGLCLFKQEKNIVSIPSVVIWDSIANTLSQKERETEDINSVIGYKARVLSLLVPKYVAKISKNNICWIAINQYRDNIKLGNFEPAKELKFMTQGKSIPGGNTIKFNAFQLLEMKHGVILTNEKGYGFDGVTCKIKCIKNKLFTPNIEIEIVGSFVHGFSNFWTNYKFLVDNKRLTSGAWNYLISMPEKKFRTKDARQFYIEDEHFRNMYDQEVKNVIQTEIIDKYSHGNIENIIM